MFTMYIDVALTMGLTGVHLALIAVVVDLSIPGITIIRAI
jgi:hypothetical protein